MDDFNRSKGLQNIYMTPATRSLLIAEFNADLDIRQNLKAIAPGEEVETEGVRISLLSSGHMLGSAQVAVELEDGTRLGYSGDFQWPIDPVIRVDGLVVDSTYGSPDTRKTFTQSDVEDRFRDLIKSRLKLGPVLVKAYRGTAQRALQILSGSVECAVVGSPKLCKSIPIYQEFGYAVGPVLDCESDEGKAALTSGDSFIRLYGHTDQFPVDSHPASTVVLSAFAAHPDDPIMEYSVRACRVALTDHADFDGTLAYVEATGAKYVVTDNTRPGYAIELAGELRRRLNIEARPSSNAASLEWGV
jgi:putative mRNA 3-end processing factor